MGLFDVFSKGGKYFGKAIAPRCEYCEFGKRASNGEKVLCTKKGLVDAGYHCPKFTYSPLKRIPVKQMNIVGFLEGDYDEKNFDEVPVKAQKPAKPTADAPKEEPKKTEEKPAAATESEVKPAIDAKAAADDLASLAAAAEAAGEYVADAADAPADEEDAAAPAATLDAL